MNRFMNFVSGVLFIFITCHAFANDLTQAKGHLLFMMQQGEHEQALTLYQKLFQSTNQHDFDLLHQMSLRILDYGFRKQDPECQLLALFGASVSAHDDAYYILEESLKSKFPQIQLVALGALSNFQTDQADRAILRALGSPFLQVRYEATHQLCKKRHPQGVTQAESLMYKTPSYLLGIYPPLFAMVGDSYSTRILRKLFMQNAPLLRLSVIISIAKYKRDDLLSFLRQQVLHLDSSLQEACAYAFHCLKDEQSIPKLEKLARSHDVNVRLAAQFALLELGREEFLEVIEATARKGNVFAIQILGSLPNPSEVLIDLMQEKDQQVRFNALVGLLRQKQPEALEFLDEIFLRDKRDLAYISTQSPGTTLKAWKIVPSASQLLKDDMDSYQEHVNLKKSLLNKVRELSEPVFISLAHRIFNRQQNELVPYTVEILEEINSGESIQCLQEHQQQLGAPLVRQYCNLALYQLNEPGAYGEQLRSWVKNQNKTQFIQFKAVDPWLLYENSYTLTPHETSQLLVETFKSFAIKQDKEGIEALIEAIATGHEKNRYALAGLLLRATQ